MRTIQVSATVKELREHRYDFMDIYWTDDTGQPFFWLHKHAATDQPRKGDTNAERLVGDYQSFLEASGRSTLDGLPEDEVITASFEIPDRKPDRPRQRTELQESSTINLPTRLLQEVDEVKGTDSRHAFIEAAINEKVAREIEQDSNPNS
jgi:hypothetical protein